MMHKRILSVYGIYKHKAGFSLIEIVVAMLIIGIMATIAIPRFITLGARTTDKFIIALNNLNQTAVQQAYETQKTQKVILDFKQNSVKLENGESIEIPEYLEFINLSIAGKSEYTSGEAYYLINAEGLAQEVKMDINNKETNNTQSILLNPFSVQFRLI